MSSTPFPTRKSIRLKGYDYSRAGAYFITICTKDMNCFFGEVVDKKMLLNDIGKIALENWLNIPDHFKNAVLHEYVVMPNHIHGILVLQTPPGVVDDAVGASHVMPVVDRRDMSVGPPYMVAGNDNHGTTNVGPPYMMAGDENNNAMPATDNTTATNDGINTGVGASHVMPALNDVNKPVGPPYMVAGNDNTNMSTTTYNTPDGNNTNIPDTDNNNINNPRPPYMVALQGDDVDGNKRASDKMPETNVPNENIDNPRPPYMVALQGDDADGNKRASYMMPAQRLRKSTANQNQFSKPIPGSVSVIIQQYKASVRRWCNENGHNYFQWQSRFNDHIIRDEQEYERISAYINSNPANWKEDKFFRK